MSSLTGSAGCGSQFLFELLAVALDHLNEERRNRCPAASGPGTLERNTVEEFPKVRWQVDARGLVRSLLWRGCGCLLCHEALVYLLSIVDW
jgi:hypothetical protein